MCEVIHEVISIAKRWGCAMDNDRLTHFKAGLDGTPVIISLDKLKLQYSNNLETGSTSPCNPSL